MKQLGVAECIITKVQTTTGGGFRLTFDLPDTEIALVQKLLEKLSKNDPLVYVSCAEKANG